MRLRRLYLKGYANILNAMDRMELNIDFSRCRHKIVVIRSENGSGKSSIINELHPFFSSPQVWLEDMEIVKIVEFDLNDGTSLSINYNGWKAKTTRPKPSRCYIRRNYPDGRSIELNPNGNMSSGKDIICELLDINDDYMALSSISANSRGIGAMKPGERKRFMALIVSAIAPYAKMYKMLASKGSTLKSMITTLTAKLSQLGNIEVIQANLTKNGHELKVLEARKEELLKLQSDIKAKMAVLSKDGNPTQLYIEMNQQSKTISQSISEMPDEVKDFTEDQLRDVERDLIKVETRLEVLDTQLTETTKKEAEIRDALETDTIRLRSLFDQDILDDTNQRLDKAKKALSFYVNSFEQLGFHAYNDITEVEYTIALDAIERFNSTIETMGTQFSLPQIEQACSYLHNDPHTTDYQTLVESLEKKLDETKEKIEEQLDLMARSEDFSKIPTDCNHMHDCPFIKSIVQAKQSMLTDRQYVALQKAKEELVGSIEEAKQMLRDQEAMMACIYQVRDLVRHMTTMSKLLLKFPHTEKVSGTKHILDCIMRLSQLDIDISAYREYTNYVTMIASAKKDIQSLEEKMNTLTNSNRESWALQNSIESKSVQLQQILDSKAGSLAEFKNLKNEELRLKQHNQYLETIRAQKSQYEAFSIELADLSKSITEMKEVVDQYQELESNLANLTTQYNDLTMVSIPELQNQLEQAKYQMILFDQYRKDYSEYSQLYDRLEMVKQHTSINGIQAEIMDYTMNQIISMVNQLSAMLFGGRFSLDKFEITADDFLISFYDAETGKVRPDISMMSASQLGQLSMIISFVLLHNASEKFNIIRLDEVDNNLDNDNRLRFFGLVDMIMQILNFDQAIIISHNVELDLSTCDLIITRLQNPEAYRALLNSGANIIADFMRR